MPKKPCVRWGRDLPREGNFLWLSYPFESTDSLCCGIRSKADHSIVSTVTTCDEGDKSAMRPFAKLLWILVIFIIISCYSTTNNICEILISHCPVASKQFKPSFTAHSLVASIFGRENRTQHNRNGRSGRVGLNRSIYVLG